MSLGSQHGCLQTTKTNKSMLQKTETTKVLLLTTYIEAKLPGNKDKQTFQFLVNNFSGTNTCKMTDLGHACN